MEYDSLEGTIKLYNNQVFGCGQHQRVIRSSDAAQGRSTLPGSAARRVRSALQNDGFLLKASPRRVAVRHVQDRENYEKYWDVLRLSSNSSIKDEKFAEEDGEIAILFKNLDGKYRPLRTPQENGA